MATLTFLEVIVLSKNAANAAPAKNRKKLHGWKRRLLIGLGIFLINVFFLFCVGLFIVFYYIGKIDIVVDDPSSTVIMDGPDEDVDSTLSNAPDHEIEDLESSISSNAGSGEVMYSDDVINILLIGTDGRTVAERGRSDSMILISVNKLTKKIYMTSFLRDTYVDIPGVEKHNRLNAAYSFGGTSLLLDTIEANYKIYIDDYIRVNFDCFKETIDILGGVEMTVTDAEAGHIPGISSGGTYLLNGNQALAYARIRKVGGNGDFGRTERQRKVLNVLFQRCKNLSISELNDLLNQLLPNLTTNLTTNELFGLILSSPTYFSYDLVQQQIPKNGTWSYMTVRHMSVLKVDFKENTAYIKETIFEGVY